MFKKLYFNSLDSELQKVLSCMKEDTVLYMLRELK